MSRPQSPLQLDTPVAEPRHPKQNYLQFIGHILERDVLRYTPAGVPIVGVVLAHTSQQVETGIARLVEFEVSALAAGEISGRLGHAELRACYQFEGFLARKSRNSKVLVFHIIEFKSAQLAK